MYYYGIAVALNAQGSERASGIVNGGVPRRAARRDTPSLFVATLLLPRASHSQLGTGNSAHPAARSCRRLTLFIYKVMAVRRSVRRRSDYIPSLTAMAALTLFHNQDVSVDYTPYAAPATTIQKIIRSYLSRARTVLGRFSEGNARRGYFSTRGNPILPVFGHVPPIWVSSYKYTGHESAAHELSEDTVYYG